MNPSPTNDPRQVKTLLLGLVLPSAIGALLCLALFAEFSTGPGHGRSGAGPRRMSAQMQPQRQLQIQPQIQPRMQPQIQPRMQPQIQPQIQPRMQPRMQPQMQPQMPAPAVRMAPPRAPLLPAAAAPPPACATCPTRANCFPPASPVALTLPPVGMAPAMRRARLPGCTTPTRAW